MFDFAAWCKKTPDIEFILIIEEKKRNKRHETSLKHSFWKLIKFIENLRINNTNHKDHLDVIGISNFKGIERLLLDINIDLSTKKFSDLELDLIISFDCTDTFMLLKDLTIKGGLFYSGNPHSSRKVRPIAFEEVLLKKYKTSFSIVHAKTNNDFELIFLGSFLTSFYFLSNQANLFSRRNYYLKRCISQFMDGVDFNNKPFRKSVSEIPTFKDQIRYACGVISSYFRLLYKRFSGKRIFWEVYFSKSHWKEFDISGANLINTPANQYIADPFVFKYENLNICFVENFDYHKQKGHISAYELKDNGAVDLGCVIEEPFHMSFPYVFKFEEKIYLLPETSQNNDIRLYECISFPDRWRLKRVLMRNVSAADSLIFEYNEIWWLFSNINPNDSSDHCSELSIYWSMNPLEDTWIPHLQNPVIVDPGIARNGGIFQDKDKIYRVSQKQGFGEYGVGFEINEIISLSPKEYFEKKSLKTFNQRDINSHHFHSNGNFTVQDRWKLINR